MVFWMALLAFVVSFILVRPLLNFLSSANFVAQNYKGVKIPIGTGLLWVEVFLVCVATAGILNYFIGESLYFSKDFYVIATLILGSSLIGFIDDRSTNVERGLTKHFKALLKGKVTTGFIKATSGLIIAVIAALNLSNSLELVVINTLIIALFMNAINLLDTRPGRALIGFMGLLILIILGTLLAKNVEIGAVWHLWGVFLAPGIALMPSEIKGESMLGDTGSNMLGAILGYLLAASFEINVKIAILIVLVIFNIFADRVSITKLLEKRTDKGV